MESDIDVISPVAESHHRVLRKRLRMFYEALVQSLGESADNISFLLRMAEDVGKCFVPIPEING